MRFAGIDIGSRAIKLVVVDAAGNVLKSARSDTGFDPLAAAEKLIDGVAFDRILATGYGRSLFEIAIEAPTVTEIKAHATGARACFPEARAVLDIGGQDSKAIALFENGKVKKFEMNDRCAAGTGKFLEIMARTLGFAIADFGKGSPDRRRGAQHLQHVHRICRIRSHLPDRQGTEPAGDRPGPACQRHPPGRGHDQPGIFGRRYRVHWRGGPKSLYAKAAGGQIAPQDRCAG